MMESNGDMDGRKLLRFVRFIPRRGGRHHATGVRLRKDGAFTLCGELAAAYQAGQGFALYWSKEREVGFGPCDDGEFRASKDMRIPGSAFCREHGLQVKAATFFPAVRTGSPKIAFYIDVSMLFQASLAEPPTVRPALIAVDHPKGFLPAGASR